VPNILIQNLTTEDVHLGDFYTKVPKPENRGPCYPIELGTVESFKTSVELMQSVSLQKAIAEGKVSLGITFTQDEIDSGFDIWPGLTDAPIDIEILDEGIQVSPDVSSINFVGDAVEATAVGSDITVTVSGVAGSNRIFNEVPSGAIDGINTAYTTASNFVPGTEELYLNGVHLREGVGCDFTRSESGGVGTGFDTVTLAVIPIVGDQLWIHYNPAA
jgi:hypothetical protein